MSQVRIEQASGLTNGINHDFYTLQPFNLSATVQVFLNGQLLNPTQYIATAPNHIHLTDAPRTGEVVQVYYKPS